MVCKGGTDQFLHFYGGTQKLSMFEHYTFRWVGLSVGRSDKSFNVFRDLNRRKRTDAGRGPFPRIVPSLTLKLVPTTSTHHTNYEEGCGPTQGGTSLTRTSPTTSRAQGHQRQPSLTRTGAAKTSKPGYADLTA